MLDAVDEGGRGFTGRQTSPMNLTDSLRHFLVILPRIVNDDGDEEGASGADQVRSIHCQSPLEPEIALSALMRVARDHRNEEGASPDLPADRLIPRIPPAQLALVEPHLDPGRAQSLSDALSG